MVYTLNANDTTLGITSGNESLNMPPFAVDIVAGQGNGDVTDAVIALRGKILNDTSCQPEATVHFVACNWEEAETVAVALEQWAEALRENEDATDDDAVFTHHLAARYRLVPNPHRKPAELPELPPVGAMVRARYTLDGGGHFTWPEGWVGTVKTSTEDLIEVECIRYLGPGANEWDNCRVITTDDGANALHNDGKEAATHSKAATTAYGFHYEFEVIS